MNQRPRKAPQGELFPLEHPSALLTGERREVLIPLFFDDPGGGNGNRGRGVKQPHDRGSQP